MKPLRLRAVLTVVDGVLTCKFTSSNLKLDDGSNITRLVQEGGRQIQCHNKFTSSFGDGISWYVLLLWLVVACCHNDT